MLILPSKICCYNALLAETEQVSSCQWSDSKMVENSKMSDNRREEPTKAPEKTAADPYKLTSSNLEDKDLLNTLIPGFECAVCASASKTSVQGMGDEPKDFLNFLLSSS